MTIDFGDLIDPQYLKSVKCIVWAFAIGHGELWIELTHPQIKRRIMLIFNGVDYFSGPISWQGAEFTSGSYQETLELLKTIQLYNSQGLELWAQKYTLHKINLDGHSVSILALIHRFEIVEGWDGSIG